MSKAFLSTGARFTAKVALRQWRGFHCTGAVQQAKTSHWRYQKKWIEVLLFWQFLHRKWYHYALMFLCILWWYFLPQKKIYKIFSVIPIQKPIIPMNPHPLKPGQKFKNRIEDQPSWFSQLSHTVTVFLSSGLYLWCFWTNFCLYGVKIVI